jgi:xanthine dehydrogenase/oxidase
VSSLAGNICTGSPISDLNPLWMVGRAVFTVVGQGSGERRVPASAFFLGYRWGALVQGRAGWARRLGAQAGRAG